MAFALKYFASSFPMIDAQDYVILSFTWPIDKAEEQVLPLESRCLIKSVGEVSSYAKEKRGGLFQV